jgi:hypothetical protein
MLHANEALQRIAALYRIETDIRGCEPDKRCAVRQERSLPFSPDSNRGCVQSSSLDM